jgi:hypothetical protein
MPKNLLNKSTRIFHTKTGMLPPGAEGEFSDEELESPVFKTAVEAGELAEPGEAKKEAKAAQKEGDKPPPNQPATSVQGDKVKG